MRIATSTIYNNQVSSIDSLVAAQQQYGAQLSSGKQLNAPSDDPTAIGQDLSLRTSIAQENQASQNIQNASAQLTTVDGSLSSLSDVMQSARGIAVQAGSGLLNGTQRQALANQVDGLIQEAIGLANTAYAGKYVFAGTASPTSPPVVATGQPVTAVTFNGNLGGQTEQMYDGQSVSTSIDLQQAFNYKSSDGSPDVFQTLIALRDTIVKGTVTSESAQSVNNASTAFSAGAGAQSINSAGMLKTPLVADANGNAAISITSASAPGGVTIVIPGTDTVPQAVAAINAQTAATGVTASFDYKQQRLILSSPSGDFQVTDVPSPGPPAAPAAGNFVEAFGLQSQANLTSETSRQLGDIDRATQTLLNARATVGGTLQSLASLGDAVGSQTVNDTKVQSGIEDADIAKVISQFSQTQTALQAAYGTTTRLESKTLFDYLQ